MIAEVAEKPPARHCGGSRNPQERPSLDACFRRRDIRIGRCISPPFWSLTVFRAYQELLALGYLESRPGSYTTVRDKPKTTVCEPTRERGLLHWGRLSNTPSQTVVGLHHSELPEPHRPHIPASSPRDAVEALRGSSSWMLETPTYAKPITVRSAQRPWTTSLPRSSQRTG
jgi:hypothetical protein